jgi:hypothetical protein
LIVAPALVVVANGELVSVPPEPASESIVTLGAVVSFVTVTVSLVPVLVAASVTQTRSVFGPALRSTAAIAVATEAGEVE